MSYALSDGTVKNATYRIYLGGNSTGDMNLLRNTQYNITTFLYGANTADTRITVEDVTPADVVETENANCYMIDMSDMPSAGFKKVTIPLQQVKLGWDKISASTASTVQTMLESGNWEIQTEWRTWDGRNITGTQSSDFSADNLKATLNIPVDAKNGNNAVVKLVSGGTTYWSWHLWFTDYKPDELTDAARHGQVHQYANNAFQTGIYKDKYMMDRNLGATITGVTGAISQPSTTDDAIKYYGLMYQWGRKDPFIGSNGKKEGSSSSYSDFVSIYDGTTGESPNKGRIPFKISGGPTTLASSVQNPGTFFYYGSGTKDWLSPQNHNLWDNSGTAKSVFDPCPSGWRVPIGNSTSNNPWYGFTTSSNFTWKKSATGTGGCLYNDNGVQAWYPVTGCFEYSNGALANVGIYGYYWTASPYNSEGSYFFGFDSSSVAPLSNYGRHACGMPVRCIQE